MYNNVCKIVLCIIFVIYIQTIQASEQDVHSAFPSLPDSISLAANLIRENDWFALGNNEITCINKIITQDPFFAAPGTKFDPLLLNNKIILWGKKGDSLVPTDIIKCDDNIYIVFSIKKGRYYKVDNENDRNLLLDLITRIRKGIEKKVGRNE